MGSCSTVSLQITKFYSFVFYPLLYIVHVVFLWSREAQLVGEFNGWNGSKHKMQRNEFGVWTIRIPDEGDKSSIPHNSKVKFRFKHGNGVWVDRIPAWIRYATVEPNSFGAAYDGVYWDPPPSERS